MTTKRVRRMLLGIAFLFLATGFVAAQERPAALLSPPAAGAPGNGSPRELQGGGAASGASLPSGAKASDYRHREEAARDLDEWRGGHEVEVVYVSGVAIVVVALVILLIILI